MCYIEPNMKNDFILTICSSIISLMLYTYSGTGLSIYLTDRMGRKALLLLSGFGMAAAMSLLVSP